MNKSNIIMINHNIYYQDIFIFINQIKNYIVVKIKIILKANFYIYLQDTAL